MITEIPVLNNGYVMYVRHMGDDMSPVEDARMSTDNLSGIDVEKDDKLREYLWKNQHTSPFEGCVLCLELKVPLFILHQMDRHRTIDFGAIEHTIETYDEFRKFSSRNEKSGRYSSFKDEFYIPDPSRIKMQSKNNKQGSGQELDKQTQEEFVHMLGFHTRQTYDTYKEYLDKGVALEVDRMFIMPHVYTKIRITANLLNWFKFLRLRLDSHAQYEVQVYAIAVEQIVKELWPKCWTLFDKYSKINS